MSDDPVRNGISRLDEMMSGDVRSTLRSISLMVAYTLLYSLSLSYYRCRCDSAEFSLDTDWLVCVAEFYRLKKTKKSCNKVTPKCNRVTLKEQSELTNN